MLQGVVEYLGLLLIKCSDPQIYSNGHKGVFLLQCTMKSPISVYQEWFKNNF